METVVISFFDPDGRYDDSSVAALYGIFSGANVKVCRAYGIKTGDREEFYKLFSEIRQAYDNVFVIKCKYNGYDESAAVSSAEKSDYVYTDGNFSCAFSDENSLKTVADAFIAHLNEKYDVRYGKVVFGVFGLGENAIREKLVKIARDNVKFYVSGKNLDYKVEIVYDDKSTKMEYDAAQKDFIGEFRDNIYASEDVSLAETLVNLLRLRKCRFSCAESFTGGGIAKMMVSVPGASDVFYEGVVSYNEESKALRLGVDRDDLAKYKPVSGQVAGEMVQGLIATGKVEVAVSTTGIAGPASDDSGFPVGLCYIGVACGDDVKVYKHTFDGTRADIMEKGAKAAVFTAIKILKDF